MPSRSILALASCGVIAVAFGAAILDTSAAGGSPAVVQRPAVEHPAAVPQKPAPVLHLPTTLHLVTLAYAQVQPDSSHAIFTQNIYKPGSKKQIGTAALSCENVGRPSLPLVCTGGIALRDGSFLVQENIDQTSAATTGKVLAGSGSYSGARGNLSGRAKGGGRSSLTLNFTLG